MAFSENISDHLQASEFHTNVARLYKKTREPSGPVDYLQEKYTHDTRYMLLHEEEQHLADGIAFLAQTEAGPSTVSAVTLEQENNPPALTVRLAANKTPSVKTVTDLNAVLTIVSESARTGRNQGEFTRRLFFCVVEMSQGRILDRIHSKYRKRSGHQKSASASRPLYSKVTDLIMVIPNSKKWNTLRILLAVLKTTLLDVEAGLLEHRLEHLEQVVRQCFAMSHINKAKSLESYLQLLGFEIEITMYRTVVEIDKLARYYGIVEELICFSRRPDTKELFSSILLETLTAPAEHIPLGANGACRVHGEVQLVLHHARYPAKNGLAPRTIGSSKLACFLCDLFVSKYGGFGISGTHGKLYEAWYVPWEEWMRDSDERRIREVVRQMNQAVSRYLFKSRRITALGNRVESRVHILHIPPGLKISSPAASVLSTHTNNEMEIPHTAPSKLSSVAEDVAENHSSMVTEVEESLYQKREEKESAFAVRTLSEVASDVGSQSTITVQRTEYHGEDLPIEIIMSRELNSCWLDYGSVEYFIDTQNCDSGTIKLSKLSSKSVSLGQRRVDARDLNLREELELTPETDERTLAFVVRDHGKHELFVEVKWTSDYMS